MSIAALCYRLLIPDIGQVSVVRNVARFPSCFTRTAGGEMPCGAALVSRGGVCLCVFFLRMPAVLAQKGSHAEVHLHVVLSVILYF